MVDGGEMVSSRAIVTVLAATKDESSATGAPNVDANLKEIYMYHKYMMLKHRLHQNTQEQRTYTAGSTLATSESMAFVTSDARREARSAGPPVPATTTLERRRPCKAPTYCAPMQ